MITGAAEDEGMRNGIDGGDFDLPAHVIIGKKTECFGLFL